MGKVTQLVRQIIRKQIDEHGIVVLYDPSAQYEEALESFNMLGTTVLRFNGSIFQLQNSCNEVESVFLPYIEYNPLDMHSRIQIAIYG